MTTRLPIISFYVLGILVFVPSLVVIWIANEDILAGSTLPSSVVFIAGSMDIVGKLVTIFVVNRMPLLVLMILHSLSFAGGLVLLVMLPVNTRIIGVIIVGYCYGFGVVLYLRQSANFEESDKLSSAFNSGSNTASLIASFGYIGLTTWMCVAPRIVIASCIPVCFITLGFYPFLFSKSSTRQKIDITKYHTIPQAPTSKDTPKSTTTKLPISRRMTFLFKVFPFASYLSLANFYLGISLTSKLTTLTFPSSPFLPRDHYQYYRLVSDIGIALGGLEVVLVSCLSPKHVEFVRIRRVWFLVVLHAAFAVFFMFASWFRLLPNVYTLLILAFVQGLVHGSINVHVIGLVSELFHNAREKGAAMGFAEIGFSFGRLAAGLLGVFVEQTLRHHCSNALLLGHYCLARIPTTNGWETNVHC